MIENKATYSKDKKNNTGTQAGEFVKFERGEFYHLYSKPP